MKTLALGSLLLLSAFTAFSQDSSALSDQAPPAVDEALRARVKKFYDAFVEGKFKEAYLLVADDSQDKFFESAKGEYKGCEIIRINYTKDSTEATVVSSCKRNWRFHGAVTLTTFPLTSTWKVIDGQWYWHFVKPSIVPNPFSPTGFVQVPPDSSSNDVGLIPNDINGAARGILSKVGIDRSSVRLLSTQLSQDVVHVRNDMPGEVSVKIDQPNVPGLKVSVGKSDLQAHDQTTISFEWSPEGCSDCARMPNSRTTVQVHIEPTGQVFPITVAIENTPQVSTSPQK
jgi:hypothetical protein